MDEKLIAQVNKRCAGKRTADLFALRIAAEWIILVSLIVWRVI
jgi:hypothetical protein